VYLLIQSLPAINSPSLPANFPLDAPIAFFLGLDASLLFHCLPLPSCIINWPKSNATSASHDSPPRIPIIYLDEGVYAMRT